MGLFARFFPASEKCCQLPMAHENQAVLRQFPEICLACARAPKMAFVKNEPSSALCFPAFAGWKKHMAREKAGESGGKAEELYILLGRISRPKGLEILPYKRI